MSRQRPLLGCGLLGLGLGLGLPWLAVPLEADRSPFSLSVALAGVPSAPPFTYGAALAFCLGLGLVAAVRSRCWPGAATAGVGLAALVVCVTFVVAAGATDWPLQQRLRDQAAQRTAIFHQFSYPMPGDEPRIMLAGPVTGSSATLAGQLRLGWLCAAAGGALLLLSGASGLRHELRRTGWRAVVPASAGLLLAAGLVGRGVLAGALAEQGGEAARAGDPHAAESSLAVARALDPSLAASASYQLALGRAELASGERGRPLAVFAEAQSRGAAGNRSQQVAELQLAAKGDPNDPVLVQQLSTASEELALAADDPGPLQALPSPGAAAEYTLGRILYRRGDYAAAERCFQRVLTQTGDPDVASSAYTYMSLSETDLGHADQARHDLLRAVAVDTGYRNVLARSLATGLYATDDPGGAS